MSTGCRAIRPRGGARLLYASTCVRLWAGLSASRAFSPNCVPCFFYCGISTCQLKGGSVPGAVAQYFRAYERPHCQQLIIPKDSGSEKVQQKHMIG